MFRNGLVRTSVSFHFLTRPEVGSSFSGRLPLPPLGPAILKPNLDSESNKRSVVLILFLAGQFSLMLLFWVVRLPVVLAVVLALVVVLAIAVVLAVM